MPAVCLRDRCAQRGAALTAGDTGYLELIRSTTALPMIYRQFPRIDGEKMADGGVVDPIPVARAIEIGANKIVVVRARHYDYMKTDTLGHRFIRWKSRHNPALVAVMRGRIRLHRYTISLLRDPPQGVEIIEVCPPVSFNIGRFSRNLDRLAQGYRAGLEQGRLVIERYVKCQDSLS